MNASTPLSPGDTIHREPHSAKEIRLPSSTEEFLDPSTKQSSRPPPTNDSVTATPSKHAHHSTVVRPPGPASEAKGSHHHAIVDPEEYPDLRRTLSRGMSSQSNYSQDSVGTIESDEEAKELLAHADSGPQLIDEPEKDLVGDLLPSDKQVEMAREILRDPVRPLRKI